MAITPSITFDQLSQRINTICDDFVKEAKECKQKYDSDLDDLKAAIDASPDLDQDAAISIVFGRVKRMMTEAAEALA
jgi:hypothetical protein